jgi:hypothetical protein
MLNSHQYRRKGPVLFAHSLTIFFAIVGFAMIGRAQVAPVSGQQNKIVNDFGTRVSQYLESRQKMAGAPAKQSNSSEKLVDQQKQAAEKIRAARANAKQGDIFTPEIADYFRNQIAASLGGNNGKKIRSNLRHSEPVHGLALRVNETYPQGVPLQTMPPSLLQHLPVLPTELEYRFIGRDLVLHDIEPNIIVDFISNAISMR